MADTSREENFTTVRIRVWAREMLEEVSFPREASWETFDRVMREFLANRLKKEGGK